MAATGDTGFAQGLARGPGIVTPDAVGLDLEIATVGSRGAAYLLDLVLFGAVLALLMVSQALLGSAGFVPGWFGIALLLVLAFAWQFGYPIGFEVLRSGRTPGKAALGLRVVTVEGSPVRLRHATVRATVGVLELLGTLGGIAIVSSFVSPRHQRLGDLAAGTLVVRERRGGGTPTAERFAAPAGYEAYAARLDVSGLRAPDYAAVRETLRRARELSPAVREQVTVALASELVTRVGPPPPDGCSAEAFLGCVAAAVQARRAPTPPGPATPPVTTTGPAPAPHPGPPGPSVTPGPMPPGDAEGPPRGLGGFAPPA